jgi:hypothetical protein
MGQQNAACFLTWFLFEDCFQIHGGTLAHHSQASFPASPSRQSHRFLHSPTVPTSKVQDVGLQRPIADPRRSDNGDFFGVQEDHPST